MVGWAAEVPRKVRRSIRGQSSGNGSRAGDPFGRLGAGQELALVYRPIERSHTAREKAANAAAPARAASASRGPKSLPRSARAGKVVMMASGTSQVKTKRRI